MNFESSVPVIASGAASPRVLHDPGSAPPDPHVLRRALLDRGYDPLPISADEKGPAGVHGWQSVEITLTWLDGHAGKPNTGLRCGPLVAIDVDVFDHDAGSRILEIIEDVVGPMLCVRVGRVGYAVLGRTDQPRKKQVLTVRREALKDEPIVRPAMGADPERPHKPKIEFLGEGQQLAAFGQHPAGTNYTWSGHWLDTEYDAPTPSHSPLEVPFDRLPLIDDAKRTEIIKRLVEAGLVDEPGGDQRTADNTAAGAGELRQSEPWKLATVLDVLRYCRPDQEPYSGRDGWRNAGMASRAAVIRDGERELDDNEKFAIWCLWSTGALGSHDAPGQQLDVSAVKVADDDKFEKEWRSFATEERQGHFTLASLYMEARKLGYRGSPDGRTKAEKSADAAAHYDKILPPPSSERTPDAPSAESDTPTPDSGAGERRDVPKSPRIKDWPDVRDQKPPPWIVRGLIPQRALAGLYGRGGTYKSFIALDLALHIATGRAEWGGAAIRTHGNVLYISGEGDISPRVRAWEKRNGEVGRNFSLLDGIKFAEPKDLKALDEEVEARKRAPILTVIDTLARASVGLEENSAKDMGQVVDAAREMQRAWGTTVLLVHHTPDKDVKWRGSSAVYFALDTSILAEWPDQEVGKRKAILTVDRQKDSPVGRRWDVSLEVTETGVERDGEAEDSLVVAEVKPRREPDSAAIAQPETEKLWATIARIARAEPIGPGGDGRWPWGALIYKHGPALAEALGKRGRDGKTPKRTAIHDAMKLAIAQIGEHGVRVPMVEGETTMPTLHVCREASGSRDDVWFELRGCPAVDAALAAAEARTAGGLRGAEHIARVKTMFLDFAKWDFSTNGTHIPFNLAAKRIAYELGDSYEAVAGALDRLLGIRGPGDGECMSHVVPTSGEGKSTRRTTFIKQNVDAEMLKVAADIRAARDAQSNASTS